MPLVQIAIVILVSLFLLGNSTSTDLSIYVAGLGRNCGMSTALAVGIPLS